MHFRASKLWKSDAGASGKKHFVEVHTQHMQLENSRCIKFKMSEVKMYKKSRFSLDFFNISWLSECVQKLNFDLKKNNFGMNCMYFYGPWAMMRSQRCDEKRKPSSSVPSWSWLEEARRACARLVDAFLEAVCDFCRRRREAILWGREVELPQNTRTHRAGSREQPAPPKGEELKYKNLPHADLKPQLSILS